MRPNASIPALLALATLFLLPASLLAKTTHHRSRNTAASATSHRRTKATVQVRSSRRRHARPEVTRVSAHAFAGRHLHRPNRSTTHRVRTEEASAQTPRTATSSDFLKAATVQPEKAPRTEERAEARQPVRRARRGRRVQEKAVPVSAPERQTPRTRETETAYTAPAPTPVVLYNKRGRLIMPPPLRGSHEILVRQNEVADRDGLTRIQNDEDLMEMRDKGLLVALPTSAALEVDSRLPANRRYCRPWVARFLVNLARAHYARFHTPLQVNSAVRTVDFQEHLIHVNGNAAPAEGDTASPHLTGQAVDLAKHGLSLTEIAWMRGYLLPLVQEGRIDVEEEFKQSCFHISVYKNYVPSDSTPRRSIAASSASEATLATALR